MSFRVTINIGRDDQPGDVPEIMTLYARVEATTEGDCILGMDEVAKLYVERRRWIRVVNGPTREVDFGSGVTKWFGVIRLSYVNEPGPGLALRTEGEMQLVIWAAGKSRGEVE